MKNYGRVCSVSIAVALFMATGACRQRDGSEGGASVSTIAKDPVAAVVTVADGMLVSSSPNEEQWLTEAKAQLQYATGALAGRGVWADLSRVELSTDRSAVVRKGKHYYVPYVARFNVTWPDSLPASRTLVLPKGGDAAARQAFFKLYGSTCIADGERADPVSFWHLYRPDVPACGLNEAPFDHQHAVRVTVDATAARATGRLDLSHFKLGKKLSVTFIVEGGPALNATVKAVAKDFGPAASLTTSAALFERVAAGKERLDIAVLSTSREARNVLEQRRGNGGIIILLSEKTVDAASRMVASWLARAKQNGSVKAPRLLLFMSARGSFPFATPDLVEQFSGIGGLLLVHAQSTPSKSGIPASLDTWLQLLQSGSTSLADMSEGFGGTQRLLIRETVLNTKP